MKKQISNEDLRQCLPQFVEGWWETMPEEEKAWYRRFWASCTR
jgi:hypothetical protein